MQGDVSPAHRAAEACAQPIDAPEALGQRLELADAERGRVSRLERAERSTRAEEGES